MTTTLVGKKRGTPTSRLFSGDVQRASYQHTYIISSDDADNDDEPIVLATTGLPALSDTWTGATSTDTTASVVSLSATQDEKRKSIWYVEVEYDSEVDIGQGGQGGGGGSGANPPDLSPEIEYDYETVEVELGFDAFGKTVATSAGEPFPDTSIIIQRPITVLTYSRWETNHPATVQQNYMNRCNSTPFSGAGIYTVLMSGIRARLRPIIGTRLWWTTYTMKWDPQEWYLKKADIGTFFGSLSVPTFRYTDGRLRNVALDGAGNEAADPATLTFRPYGTVDFNTLGF